MMTTAFNKLIATLVATAPLMIGGLVQAAPAPGPMGMVGPQNRISTGYARQIARTAAKQRDAARGYELAGLRYKTVSLPLADLHDPLGPGLNLNFRVSTKGQAGVALPPEQVVTVFTMKVGTSKKGVQRVRRIEDAPQPIIEPRPPVRPAVDPRPVVRPAVDPRPGTWIR
jgi:hypothetical protein